MLHRLLLIFIIFRRRCPHSFFFLDFNRNSSQKGPNKNGASATKHISFSDQNTISFTTLSFMSIFFRIELLVWSLSAPFGSLLDPFWITYGSLSAPIGSLLVSLGFLFARMAFICSLLASCFNLMGLSVFTGSAESRSVNNL